MRVFSTLAMGTRNSPRALEGFGAAFMCHVINTFLIFQDKPIDNNMCTYFIKQVNHTYFREGQVLIIVLVWIHIDDIRIYRLTLNKLTQVIDIIIDTTVLWG